MKKALAATRKEYESSSSRTPEYLAWFRLFKRELTKFLTGKGAINIAIGSPNHFDMSGFFTIGTQAWYFRVEDIRWGKDELLVRKAASYKDFTGGSNQYVDLTRTEAKFTEEFDRALASPF